MEEREKVRRPGGRSARLRAAVHQAVTDLVAERGYGGFTVSEVAARAGVADTSIYRRWGNVEALTIDVALHWLTTESPVPDTGTLAGDLRAYAGKVVQDVTGPNGLAVLRLVVALSAAGSSGEQAKETFLAERSRQMRVMLDRARDRGEPSLEVADVLDHVLAPIYVRVLFGAEPFPSGYADALVDRLLRAVGGP
ncbi:TetR/AcrR family transcriptional regulator [Lentzea sp. NPDC059081]|uniref:TetR/AcrR family transcriptional regulator n=1 Tax=Lentzea sp. NPDC059081 TaxID=3346719 RepID=UPI00369EE309